MSEQLTAEGRKWAEQNAVDSIVARVALAGDDWPAAFRSTAVLTCNENGAGDVWPQPLYAGAVA